MVYVLCLAAGTYSHAAILLRHGWRWQYGGKPIGTVVFWSALTVVDPLVALMLFVRPRVGVVLLAVLMVSDAVQNTWVVHRYGGVVWMVADQWVFLLFVFATARIVWNAAGRRTKA